MPLVNSDSLVINTFLVYEDSPSATSKTVTQGDSFNVVLVAYGHGESLQYEQLGLVPSTVIFKEYVAGDKIDTYTWLYTKTYTVNTGILLPGTYTLRFTAKTATTQSEEYSDLQLTILPKVVPIVCGNGIKEGTEQCDLGTILNGQVCNPLYGSSCTYCSTACKLITLNGPYCGDNVCNGAETCSTCSNDCGACPDNIKPVVDITNPVATTYTSHRTSLTFSVYDDNLYSCTYKLNGNAAVNIPSVVNGVRTITGITSVTGTNTWSVTCRDVTGNIGTDSVTFTVNIPYCGDGTCNNGETCSTCSTDCGVCPTVCGNGIKEGTEQCDLGTILNGQVCNPLYGSSCTYCSTACKLITVNGPYCGDNVCNGAEICSTCSNDCGTCPDNIKPVVDITNPVATTYTSHRTSLTFSVYDDNLYSCTYKLNGNTAVNVPSVVNGVRTITGITSVTGTNTWSVTCRDVTGNIGTDSVTFTVTLPTVCGNGIKEGTEQCDLGTILNGQVCNPLYGSSCTYCSTACKLITVNGPYCGDNVCNGAETCSTCSNDCGTCPAVCDLTNAYWSKSSVLTGTVVSLIVQGTNCNGKTIDFAVYQDKLLGDVYVTNTATATFSTSNSVNSNWVAIAPLNGDTTPTYYFIAKVIGSSESVTSGYLNVTIPLTCGDGTCNGNETCSTCPTDCGVCPDNVNPIVDIINPLATTYTSHRTSLTFSVYDTNLESCTYKLNGASPVNVVSLKNGINVITGITSVTGINTWSVTCRDVAGNIGTDSVTFTVTCAPTCGDGTCNGNETCSTCPTDCGICPKNCTVCKDSKPLDDSNYIPTKKPTVIYQDETDNNANSNEKGNFLLENKFPLIALSIIMGVLILLIFIIIIRVSRR
jgi:hypothetical protein